MAQLPGSAFLKGRDRIVRISETKSARVVPAANGSGDPNGTYTAPASSAIENTTFITGLTSAEYTPSPTSQEFFLMGDDGFRDSVGTTMAGELACTAFFIQELDAGKAKQEIDGALTLIMKSENDPDRELYVEVLTYLGKDGSNHMYNVRAFNSCITGVSESAASDGIIEYSWSFQSRGQIFVGKLNNLTNKIDIYA